jgi:alpha-mannosidase
VDIFINGTGRPLYWQAWDVEVFHLETRKELAPGKVTILEEGPLVSSILVETKISETSWIKTTISLSAAVGPDAGTYLTFDNELEWRETMKFLKVEFPVDVYNTEASYETQYGITKRPTHFNTTWDMAKFEVCCHKFADLSEHNYGVSILNDCKYGFATQGNVMRLSLIRAPKAPDANADMGRHAFKYAIYPHRGGLSEQTVRAARDFGNPLKAAWTSKENLESVKAKLEMVSIEGDSNIMLDVVKRGEDDKDVSTGGLPTKEGRGVVVRVYDALGGKGKAKIHVRGKKVVRAWKTNLLEDEEEELKVEGSKVAIELRGFEVATYRLVLED